MKITVRENTFETNSSSVHAIVVMHKDDYDFWKSPLHFHNYISLYHEVKNAQEPIDIRVEYPTLVSTPNAIDLGKMWLEQDDVNFTDLIKCSIISNNMYSELEWNDRVEAYQEYEDENGDMIIDITYRAKLGWF